MTMYVNPITNRNRTYKPVL